jgi:hypothetical protein
MMAWSEVALQERTMCSNLPSTGTAVLTTGGNLPILQMKYLTSHVHQMKKARLFSPTSKLTNIFTWTIIFKHQAPLYNFFIGKHQLLLQKILDMEVGVKISPQNRK